MLAPERLEVLYHNRLIFSTEGKWLHPLFALERQIENFTVGLRAEPQAYLLRDRIAGKAAAALIIHLGFCQCEIQVLSQPALDLLNHYGIACQYHQLVERIRCKTEHLLSELDSVAEIYQVLALRREAVLKGDS